MNIYLFVYHAIPTKGSLEFGKVGGAHIEIWVNEPTVEQAKIKALDFLIDYSWNVIELENELVINEEQISQYAEDVQPLYFKALNDGIAAFFIAYPIEERDDAVIEVRRVNKNLLNPSSVN